MKLITQLHLKSRLRTSGTVPPLSPYAFNFVPRNKFTFISADDFDGPASSKRQRLTIKTPQTNFRNELFSTESCYFLRRYVPTCRRNLLLQTPCYLLSDSAKISPHIQRIIRFHSAGKKIIFLEHKNLLTH